MSGRAKFLQNPTCAFAGRAYFSGNTADRVFSGKLLILMTTLITWLLDVSAIPTDTILWAGDGLWAALFLAASLLVTVSALVWQRERSRDVALETPACDDGERLSHMDSRLPSAA